MFKNAALHISPVRAREIAMREADAANAVFAAQRLEEDGERYIYELDFTANFMDYICYIDAENGEVLGFSAMPSAA